MIGSEHPSERNGPVRHALTIDVEDWFQVENLKAQVSRGSWDAIPRRVVGNTDAILEILYRTNDTKATFFVLGWIAEREPALVQRIAEAGHEIASHGYNHELVYAQSEAAFREDVRSSKRLLEDLVGRPVLGYRAPSFSMTDAGLRILREEGFRYDSSWFPVAGHDRYGTLDLDVRTTETAHESGENGGLIPLANGLWELPLTTVKILGRSLPWAGGGYFRLIPYAVYRAGFARAARQRQEALIRAGRPPDAAGCVFYLHPWEVDPGQPRMRGLSPLYRFRHYVGLARTAGRFERLVQDFSFCPARDWLERIEQTL